MIYSLIVQTSKSGAAPVGPSLEVVMFGWDLPAGCTLADIEEAYGSGEEHKPVRQQVKREASAIDFEFELFDPRELENAPFEF